MFFLLIIAPYLVAVLLVYGVTWLIKKRLWNSKKKKFVFTIIASLILFPTILPAVAGFPTPNIGLLIVLTFFELDPMAYFDLTIKLWKFTLPSFIITAIIMRATANIIFFEYKPPKKG